MEKMKTALTIAGSDCSGGAGIQADLKTFIAHGIFGMSAVTSVVAENTVHVISIQDIQPDIIEQQIDAVFQDIPPDAVKLGMLSCSTTMLVVANSLKKWKPRNVVLDPVMYAKGGCALMEPTAIETLITHVVPLADVITPNIPEAEKIAAMVIKTPEDMREAARKIHAMGCSSVIVKGGHFDGDPIDILFDGSDFYEYKTERINTKHTHGTGCTFSSAIAANLALGLKMNEAVARAKDYITNAIRYAPGLGKGNGPVNHLYKQIKEEK
jgi:hydroxymethylpyrimidine/phosphomethylpyrimidine kinase